MIRYKTIDDVPIMKFALFPKSHPDIELIKEAYRLKGAGLGIDFSK